MSFISLIPVVGKFIDKSLDIIDKRIEDKDLANQLKTEIGKLKVESELEMERLEIEKQRIELEDDKSKRDLLGKVVKNHSIPIKEFYYIYLFLVVFNNVLAPIAVSFGVAVPVLELPSELTSIINMMTGAFFTYHGVKKAVVKKIK